MPSVRPQAHSTGEKAGLSLANLSSKVFLRAVKLYMWPVILIITLMGFSLWVLSDLWGLAKEPAWWQKEDDASSLSLLLQNFDLVATIKKRN